MSSPVSSPKKAAKADEARMKRNALYLTKMLSLPKLAFSPTVSAPS